MWGDVDGCTRIYIFERIIDPERQRGESIDKMKIFCSRMEITPLSKLLAMVGRYGIDIALMMSLGS